METQIFHQVKAEYAFHYDKRCRLEGKNKAKHNLCLGPNHFLCDYLKVLYKLIILTLWFPATLLLICSRPSEGNVHQGLLSNADLVWSSWGFEGSPCALLSSCLSHSPAINAALIPKAFVCPTLVVSSFRHLLLLFNWEMNTLPTGYEEKLKILLKHECVLRHVYICTHVSECICVHVSTYKYMHEKSESQCFQSPLGIISFFTNVTEQASFTACSLWLSARFHNHTMFSCTRCMWLTAWWNWMSFWSKPLSFPAVWNSCWLCQQWEFCKNLDAAQNMNIYKKWHISKVYWPKLFENGL